MPNFFIDRPIFAWVIAILITLGGVIAIHDARHRVVSDHRAAAGRRQRELPGRGCRDGRKDRDPGHRAAAHRHRSPAVLQLDLERERRRLDHADVRARHRSRHRPGADAEQGLAGDAAPAGGGDAAGRRRRPRRTPDFLMVGMLKSDDGSLDSYALEQPARLARDRPDRSAFPASAARSSSAPNTRCASGSMPDKLHGYGLSAAQALNAVRGAERAGRRRLDRRGAGDRGQRLHRDGDRRGSLHLARAVREHHAAHEQRRHHGAPEGCRARRARARSATASSVMYNGQAVAGFGVQLITGANALGVAKAVKAKLTETAAELPAGRVLVRAVRHHATSSRSRSRKSSRR